MTAQCAHQHDRAFLLGIVDDLFDGPIENASTHDQVSPESKPAGCEGRDVEVEVETMHELGDNQQNVSSIDDVVDVDFVDDDMVVPQPGVATNPEGTREDGEEVVAPAHGPTPGIRAFNQALKNHIPRQLPVQGLRSWKLFGYVPAVLTFGYENIVTFYDFWAWDHSGQSPVDEGTIVANSYFHETWGKLYPYQNFLSVLGLAWQSFILIPFSVYLLGALVRLLVRLHELSKQPTWVSFAVFLPLLLLLESVLGLRSMLIVNLQQLMWYLLLPYDFSDIGPYVYEKKLRTNGAAIIVRDTKFQKTNMV